MNRKSGPLVFGLSVAILSLMPVAVFAASCGGADTSIIECDEGGTGAIWHIILLVVNILSGGVGIVGLIGVLVFGIQFLTAGGDTGKATKARNRMFQIVIGLVAFVLLWSGAQWLLPGGIIYNIGNVGKVSISFDKSLEIGKTVKPIIEIDGKDKSYSIDSSDESIVSAFANGSVRCNKAGKATITVAAVDGTKAETEVECVQPATGNDGGGNNNGSNGTNNGGGGNSGGNSNSVTQYNPVYELRTGRSYQYWINVPENATSGMPLIVFLHGDGERANPNALKADSTSVPMVKYLINGYSGSTPYITLVPVLPTTSSKWTDSPSSLKSLIDGVVSEYNVDKNKIYIVGFSRGATGLWKMVNDYPDYFAAAVPVSNYPQYGESALNFRHTKIWAVAGGYETTPGWNVRDGMSDFVNSIQHAGGSAKMEVYPGQYHWTISGALNNSELVNWLLEQ